MAVEVGRRHGITVVEAPVRFHSDMNILKPNVARSYDKTSYQIIKRPQAYHPHVLVTRADTGKFHHSDCNSTISQGVLCKVMLISIQNNRGAGRYQSVIHLTVSNIMVPNNDISTRSIVN